jgi:nucleolar protein 56
MESFDKLRDSLIKDTKKRIKESITDDILIIQAVTHIDDLTKVTNILAKDLREWYCYYNPEFSKSIEDHQEFVKLILNKKDKKIKDSMGADLSKEDLKPIIDLVKKIDELFDFKAQQEKYLESIMERFCPNITAVATPMIGAKLIKHAGSLRRLITMPSSTVQLLGAETALFRHIRNKMSKCPKYGVLHNHPLVMSVRSDEAGKAARMLAAKISIASRVDYGKGKFVGDKLLKEVEGKFKIKV